MCGIVGFSSFNSEVREPQETIIAMTQALSHRGPDEWGVSSGPMISLGHSRLSIVGLNNGKQPLSVLNKAYKSQEEENYQDENLLDTNSTLTLTRPGSSSQERSTSTISFNGEIYNYKSLKAELEQDGFVFNTETDTEVILHLYNKYGLDCFKQLNGMFAIAIWDEAQERLILARDRMGQKPLFYFYKNRELIFSSELKALTKHQNFTKKLSASGLNKFLTYEYIPSPHTIFEDTYKLEAGEFIIVDKNGLKKDFYWQHPHTELQGQTVTSETEAIDEIDNILNNSIKQRLVADVPVGILLSGGLDSSLVAAIAKRQSNKKLKSFSIYFNEESYDESKYIKRIAGELGLDHHAETVDAKTMLGLFNKLGYIMDEPMADPSLVPTYFLSQIAAKEVKTVLGGDGSDELFAGYPTYIANKLVNIYNIIPRELRSFISNTVYKQQNKIMPVSFKNMSWDFKLRQFLRGVGVASEVRFFRWMGGFLEAEKKDLLSLELKEKLLGSLVYEDLNRYLSRTNIQSELDRLLYLSQKMYLTDDILVKVDRASMMSSLEVRSPFLDHRLVEYVSSLPEKLKLNHFTSKYILKKTAERYIPKDIIYRAKHGFGIPISEWLCGELKEPMLDLLSPGKLKQQGLFDANYVQDLAQNHLSHKVNNRKQLWTLLSFQLWAQEFGI